MIKLKIFNLTLRGGSVAIFSKFGVIDITVIAVLVLGAIIGLTRGINKQIGRFSSAIMATFLSMHFYPVISSLIVEVFKLPQREVEITAVVVLFILFNIIFRLITWLLSFVISLHMAYPLEKSCDALLGALSYLILFSMFSYVVMMVGIPYVESLYKEVSVSGAYLLKLPLYIHNYVLIVGKVVLFGLKEAVPV